MTMPTLHAITAAFPRLEAQPLAHVRESLRRVGLLVPIATYEGEVIDGRHREELCRELGIEPEYRDYTDCGALPDVVAGLNLLRRHLDTGARALAAAALAPYYRAQVNGAKLPPGRTADRAAAEWDVSASSVKQAKRVLDHALPEVAEAVRDGRLSVSRAAEFSRLPAAEQLAAVQHEEQEALSADAGAQAARKRKQALQLALRLVGLLEQLHHPALRRFKGALEVLRRAA